MTGGFHWRAGAVSQAHPNQRSDGGGIEQLGGRRYHENRRGVSLLIPMREIMSNTVRHTLCAAVFLAMCAGAAMLGWGADIGQLIARAPRVVVLAGFALMVIVATLFPPENFFNPGRAGRLIRRQNAVPPLLAATYLALFFLSAHGDRHGWLALPGGDAIRWTGAIVFTAGAVLGTWAPLHLGRQFSQYATLQEDHVLMTGGPFRIVRHPRYLGVLLVAFGVALAFASAVALIPCAAACGLLVWRLLDEERLLAGAFPNEWPDYAARTWRLVPMIF